MEFAHTRSAPAAHRRTRQTTTAFAALGVVLVAAILGAAASAESGTITPDKLGLLPDIWPKDRRALHAKLTPVYQRGGDVHPILLEFGVHAELIRRLAATPSGPLLARRYAHRVPLAAPFLTRPQHALLETLIPGTDGAQRSLLQLRQRWAKREGDDKAHAQRAIADLDRASLAIEKRFWRIIGYALTPTQRAAMHPLLPQTHTNPAEVIGHVYQLPKFTAAQATRFQALNEQYQSENAADAAALQRADRAATAQGLTPVVRAKRQAEAMRIRTRVEDLFRRVVEDSLKIYTPAQLSALNAIPPHVTPAERLANPGELLVGVTLTPAQRQKLDALGKRLASTHQRIDRAFMERHKKLGGNEMGSDSPQSMNMAMAYHNSASQKIAAIEEIAREGVLRVLRPDQVLAWVVSP